MKSLLPVCQGGDTVDVNIEQPKQTYMVFNSLIDEYEESCVDQNFLQTFRVLYGLLESFKAFQ